MTLLSDTLAWLTPSTYTPDHLMLDRDGLPCRHDDAKRASIKGALMHLNGGRGTPAQRDRYENAVDAIEGQLDGQSLLAFERNASINDVHALLRKAMCHA